MAAISLALEVATNAVLEIGTTLLAHYGTAVSIRRKSNETSDSVTKFDREAERFLREKLALYDPSIGFKGEELPPTGREDRYWIADPIDGTEYFIRGVPFCTTMVALVDQGQVVCSVIYNFVTSELFLAELGKGATCNGLPIHVSERLLQDAYISVETNLRSSRSVETHSAIRRLATTQNIICCGYEYGLIAQGKIEGRICFDPYGKSYDYAPGSLLITEAGGRVTNIGSLDYDFYNYNFIAANIPVYEELSRPDSPLAVYM